MKATFKAVFANLLATTFSDAAVTIVNGTHTATGYVEYGTLVDFGGTVNETITGTAHVLADEIGTLSYAACVKIGTRTVFVTGQNIDGLGVENTFTFSSTNPVNAADMT